MKTMLALLLIIFGFTVNAQPIANAGPDQTIYLTQANSVTLNGSGSSGTSYLWTKIYDVQQPQAGYPVDPASIVSPTSETTTVTGLIQGTWYYQLAVTTGGVTKLDSVVVRVDAQPPPANYILERYLPFGDQKFDTLINNRNDTTQESSDPNGLTYSQGNIFINRDRCPSFLLDSSKGKLYGTVEDGYYWPFTIANPGVYGKYSRAEIFNGTSYVIDTNKTYIFEWKGYFPQSIKANLPLLDPRNPGIFAAILTIMQAHGNSNQTGPWQFKLTHDSLQFQESNAITTEGYYNSGCVNINLMSTDDVNMLNKSHTFRVETRQGKGYPGQKAYIKLYSDGVLVYQRDTGNVGQTLMHDYIKYSTIYDYRNVITSPDSLARGKKFSLVTEAFNIYTLNNASNIPPIAKAGSSQIIALPTDSVYLSGSGTDPDGTIASFLWTKISGPSAGTIGSANSASTPVAGLVQGVYQFELKVTDNQGGVGKDTVSVTVDAAPNIPPTAAAGTNQTITLPANSVSLTGSGSDADGTIASYQWTKISGPSAYNIVSPNSASTNVSGLTQGVYQFQLTVTDNAGAIGTATVQITVNAAPNIPPTAAAGTNQTITLPANSVILSGNGSDADGTIASYQWAMISGHTTYNIVNPSSSVTNVTGLTQGVYTFQLTVTDNNGAIGTATVQITVNAAANIPPTANAGTNQTITLPANSVSLSGSGNDADGTIASYLWTKISGPSSYNVVNPGSASTNVSGLVQGVYQFQLTVTDNGGAIGTGIVWVTVNPAADIPPIANAGSDVSISLPTNSVSLTGSGSDADGTITSYQWTKISGSSSYSITSPGSASTNVSGLVQGLYQFQLTVTDDKGEIGTATVQVAVNATPNIPPTANAGSNQTITLPANSVSLSGSGSDADGTISSYQWSKISGPSSYNIVNPSLPITDVSGLVQGVYQFQLSVTDNNSAIGSSTIKVIVNAAANIPPTANAGSNKSINLPINSVSLTGSGGDADGTIASYQWIKISGPSAYNIVSPNSSSTNITGLVQGLYQFQLTVTDNAGAIGTATVQVQVNAAANLPPTANAGSNQTITLPTNIASLSGSGIDADGTIASYKWTKVSGPSVFNIVNPSSSSTDVSTLVQGVYSFQLTVTDNDGAIGTSTILVTVNAASNIPPTANAGSNKSITLPVSGVSLAGSGNDADGTIVSYQWSKISGPAVFNIVNSSSPVTDVSGLVQGVYYFQLTVTDNDGAIGTAKVQITVNAAVNQPPISNAGTNQAITLPVNSVSLSGSGNDADGTIASYQWTKISGPSNYNIVSPKSASTNVTGLIQGVYAFQLKVTDNDGAIGTATVQITVNAAVNQLPISNAGTNQTITLPVNSVSLSGSGSDADGTISSYLWTKISGPSTFNIVNPSSPVTDVSGLVEGVYKFQLTVTDNKGNVSTGTVQVTVNSGIATTVSNTNIAPKANAGNDTTILAPSDSVTLNGSGTDLDGSIVGYLWKQISGPSSATFSSNNTATTDVSKLVEGTYEFELTVMDDKGLSGKDTVNVTVALGRLAPDPNYVKIYPNPVSDLATIEINTGKVNADLVILVTDMSGKSIFRKEIVTSTSVTKEQINMGTFVKGTYVITVLIDGQDQQSFKVVKL
jgi:hypothetical protein